MKEKKEKINNQTEIVSKKTILHTDKGIHTELIFEKRQDSLRALILNSKSNKNLINSVLQELYVRGLVNQIDDKIKFELPFNLHGIDCGAPDCYSTDVTFEIIAKEPIEFPKIIHVNLLEHGCGIEREISRSGIFELVEQATEYVNYYSKKLKSNLVMILNEKRGLYYFPESKPNLIKVDVINKIFDNYNEEDENGIVLYQSTAMTANEYEKFIKND